MGKMNQEDILRESIKAKYGSVNNFAKEIGMSESTIRNFFNRGLESANVTTALKICKHLGLDLEELLNGNLKVRPDPIRDRVWEEHVNKGSESGLTSDAFEVARAYSLLQTPEQKNMVRRLLDLEPLADSSPSANKLA